MTTLCVRDPWSFESCASISVSCACTTNYCIIATQMVSSAFMRPIRSRQDILTTTHSTAHQLPGKMYESLRLRFWWPHLRHDIERFVEDCDRCTRTRMPVPKRKAPLQIFSASSRFEVVHMDILGGGAAWPRLRATIAIFLSLSITSRNSLSPFHSCIKGQKTLRTRSLRTGSSVSNVLCVHGRQYVHGRRRHK